MSTDKELAYRYDLLIAPDWRVRFDTLVDENIVMPPEGRFLDLNCGTGDYAIELAERLRDKGSVIGVDSSEDRIELARAKNVVLKLENITFEVLETEGLTYGDGEFDAVIGDASMFEPAGKLGELLAEVLRVTRPDGVVVIKLTTHGSFDEFFSIYWEALLDCGIVNDSWSALEALIKERPTVSAAEEMAARMGLREVASFTSKEEFSSENGAAFLESPIVSDIFLGYWLAIAPEGCRADVRKGILQIIERERHGSPFDFSIKATVLTGLK